MKKETYNFLKQVSRIDADIDHIRNQIEELGLSLLPSGIRYDLDKVDNTPSDRLLETAAKIDELERQRVDLEQKKLKAVQEVAEVINTLERPEYKNIMSLRYIKRQPFEQIAKATGYSIDNIYKIHRKAGEWLDDNKKIKNYSSLQ